MATGTLIGFAIASRVLGGAFAPARLAQIGAAIGIPGFLAIIGASMGGGSLMFLAGTLATGLGAGLFGHATLTATMRAAPKDKIGLSLGAWGAVQATCAGFGVALGGIIRDLVVAQSGQDALTAYTYVFTIEIAFLILALLVALPLVTRKAASAISAARNT